MNYVILPATPRRKAPPIHEVRQLIEDFWHSKPYMPNAMRATVADRRGWNLDRALGALWEMIPEVEFLLAYLRNNPYWVQNNDLVNHLDDWLFDLNTLRNRPWAEMVWYCTNLNFVLSMIHHDMHQRQISPEARFHRLVHSFGPTLNHVIFFEKLSA